MIVGAGNAYVAEAKRQLYGRVGIDLLAGPSEIAIIADDTADPELVAADLLGQAEHGPTSPVALITTSEDLGRAVRAEVTRQLEDLATAEIAEAAWRDHGAIIVTRDRETAATVSDELAPEHLEVQTAEDDWYHARLRNYGSIFLGERATVAFSDKGATGTNHVLPTGHAARYTGRALRRAVLEAADVSARRSRPGGNRDRGGSRRDLGAGRAGGARSDRGQAARTSRTRGRENTMKQRTIGLLSATGALAFGACGSDETDSGGDEGGSVGGDAHDLLEPAAAGRRPDAVRGRRQRRQARARAGRRQGRQVPDQVRVARRLHRPAGRLGAGRDVGQRAQGRGRRLAPIGYIGEFNSGATAVSLPILNEAGIAQVSPGNTAVGITTDDPGSEPGEPDKYYPTGKRTYARVLPKDTYQGAALAALAKEEGCASAYILNDKEVYGAGLARNIELSAKKIGLEIKGNEGIDKNAANYRSLGAKIKGTGAGLLHLQRDHRQQRRPDLQGHGRRAARRAAARARRASARPASSIPRKAACPPTSPSRVLITIPGVAPEQYPPAGKEFLEAYARQVRRGESGPLRGLRLRVDEPAARRDQARGRQRQRPRGRGRRS